MFQVGKQGRSISFFSLQRFCWYVSRGAYLKLCWWCMWWWLIWKYALYVLFDKVTQTQMNDGEKVKFWWNVTLFNVHTWWYLNIPFTLALNTSKKWRSWIQIRFINLQVSIHPTLLLHIFPLYPTLVFTSFGTTYDANSLM